MNGTLDLSGKTGKALKLRRNILEGGLFYNFSVTVIAEDEGMNGTAFIVIKVEIRYNPLLQHTYVLI